MTKEKMIAVPYYVVEKREIIELRTEEKDGLKTIYLEGRKRGLPYYIHSNRSILGFFGIMGVISNTTALFFQEIEAGKYGLMILYKGRKKDGYGKYCIGHTKNKNRAEEWGRMLETFFQERSVP